MSPFAKWLLIGCAPVCALALTAAPGRADTVELGDAYFETIGTADDIPDQNVTAVVQDRDGFIWVGTPSGLFRFDGYGFRRVNGSVAMEALGGSFVRSLIVGRNGWLWVGTDSDGLFAFNPATAQVRHFRNSEADPASLSNDSVNALAEDPEGGIWAGTPRGLDHLSSGAASFLHFQDGPAAIADGVDGRIFALLVDRAGELWVGTRSGLGRRRQGSASIERVVFSADDRDALSAATVLSLHELRDGKIAVGTAREGAYIVSPEGKLLSQIALRGQAQLPSGAPMVFSMIQPNPAELWLAGFGGIVVVSADGHSFIRYMQHDVSIRSSLADTQILTMTQDQTGHIWMGGYGGGLQRHDPNNQSIRVLHHSPTRPASLSSPNITSVLELDNRQLWVGTRDNGIDIVDRERGLIGGIRTGGSGEGALDNALITSLAQTLDRSVWFGTVSLYRVSPESRESISISVPSPLSEATIRKLLAARDGRLWIGSNVGLWCWTPTSNLIEVISTIDGEPVSGNINAIVEAPDGRIWVGAGADGLYTLAPDAQKLQHLRLRSKTGPTLKPNIVGLLVDRDLRLWIDSAQGFYRLIDADSGEGTLDDVGARIGLGSRPIGANLLEDESGRIWTQRFVFDPKSESVHALLGADGADIGTPWFRAYTKTHDGLLLFGGSKGLMVADPSRFHPASQAAPLRVTDVSIDGHSTLGWATPAFLNIPIGSRSFSVEFAALDYSAPKGTRYEYRLRGYETQWNRQTAERRSADYGNVPPGDYTVLVRAFNRAGIPASNELAIPIRIEAAYWQTRWFVILMVVLGGALTYAGYRLRTRSIRSGARELEQRVAQRTVQLREQVEVREKIELALKLRNAELETANQQLAGTQSQLLQSEKMASVGQLAAGVAHEINNPIGYVRSNLASLKGYLSDIFGLLHAYAPIERLLDAGLPEMQRIKSFKESIDLDFLDKDIPNLLAESMAGITRVEAIVKDLKDFSHVNEAEWQEVDIHQGLESTLNVAAHEIKYKADVLREYGELPRIECLPFQLNQVFLNLLVNAANAIDGRGTITIRTGADAGEIWLQFSDTGKGIAPENLKRIFEPFFTTKPVGAGTGLGLSVSYGIIKKHGGTIEVASVVNQGTTFTIRLPIKARKVPSSLGNLEKA